MQNLTSVYVGINRTRAIQRGVNGTETPALVALDVAAMAPADRDLVAAHYSQGRGNSHGTEPRDPYLAANPRYCAILTVDEPTQECVLRTLRALDAARSAKAAEAATKLAAEIAAYLAAEDDALVHQSGAGEYVTGDFVRYARFYVHCAPDGAECEAKRGRLEKVATYKTAASREAALAERRAKLDAAAQVRRDWIALHGSQRLVAMLAEGVDCDATYERERGRYESEDFARRLESERPGWRAAEESQIDRAIADVPMSAIALLQAGRAMSATCKLAKCAGRYVCVDTFRGRTIVWPKD